MLVAGILVVLLAAFHFVTMSLVSQISNVSVEFGSVVDEVSSQDAINASLDQHWNEVPQQEFAQLEKPSPFKEIDPFGPDAMDWSSFFDGYAATGVVVADVNQDDRLDVYFLRNGNSWVVPTDGNAVLEDKPYPQYNALFINQGNDVAGNPIYENASDLAVANDTYVKEELLIENYLYPREAVTDSRDRVGRASSVAISIDLNNDGRLDFIVGNILPGMLWSHPKTQRVLGQFVRPVGRQAVKAKLPLAGQGLYFLKDYEPGDQINDVRESSRGIEPFGANSIFINLGDKDQDGLPEWQDISRETGREGTSNTMALLAEDFDQDGDLDIFEANFMDMDYWPGGSQQLAGAANRLFINQLKETGELKFIDMAKEMNVDGVYDEDFPMPDYYKLYKLPFLPEEYSMVLRKFIPYKPEYLEINGEKSEKGQISWAAVSQDVNLDGYPDIWIANDIGFLRLYINEKGKKFTLDEKQPRHSQTGYWMSLTPMDFNGDKKEDLFAGNIGGSAMNLAMPIPDLHMLFEPVMSSSTMAQQFFGGHHNSMHAIIDGASGFHEEMDHKVRHSRVLPPDASLENNIRTFVIVDNEKVDFDKNSIDPYEFTWGSTAIDVQNDGLMDLYWVGCLQGRGGGTFPIMGTGPGRFLANATKSPDQPRFIDQTAEHHVFNIQELNYDSLDAHGYIYRKSPLQNWGKRSMVYSHDVSVWGFQGPGIVERITNHDMIQTAENGRAAIAADLNGDGFNDILVRNIGGYDSRGSDSKNLKAKIDGKVRVIPAHDANFPSPTNYEPGSTRLFMNTYARNNWLKVKLIDDRPESENRNAIGARVILNDKQLQVVRAGNGGFISNYTGPVLFGLGEEVADQLWIDWPGAGEPVAYALEDLSNGTLTVSSTQGIINWNAN